MTPAERRAAKNARDRERRAAIKAGTWAFPMNGKPAKAAGGNYARAAKRALKSAAKAQSRPPKAESVGRAQTPALSAEGVAKPPRGPLYVALAFAGVALVAIGSLAWR